MPDALSTTFAALADPTRRAIFARMSLGGASVGGITRNPWSPVWPLHALSTTTFTEQGYKTLLSLEWSAYEATADEQAG